MAAHKPFRFGVEAGDTHSRAVWVAYARKVGALGYSTLIIGEHPSWGGITPTVGLMAAADATTTLPVRATDLTLSSERLEALDRIFPGPGDVAPEAYAW